MPSYRFAAFAYETEGRVLMHDGIVIHAEPKVLACIELFVRNPGVVLSAQTLLDALWPDSRVSAFALRRVIMQVRKILLHASADGLLVTVRQGGYKLDAVVTESSQPLQLHGSPPVRSFDAVQTAQQRVCVGPFLLDTIERRLTLEGRTVPLEGKAFECLVLLARAPNRLVSHQRLQLALWPEREEPRAQGLKRVLRDVRAALAEGAGVRIVARKGLGYVLEVAAEHAGQVPVRQRELGNALDDAPHEVEGSPESGHAAVPDARAALREAQAQWQADGAPDDVHAAYAHAFECAREARDVTLLAEAAIGEAVGEESALALAERYFSKRTSTARLEYALARLPRRERMLRHRVARTLCWVRGALGDVTGARAAARIALEHPPARADAPAHAMALAIACMERVWSQDAARARAALRKLCAVCASDVLAVEQRIEAHLQIMTLSLVLGDVATYKASRAALAKLAESLAPLPAARRLGQRYAIYRLSATLALVTLATIEGEFRDAERHLTELTMLSQQLGLEASGDLGVFLLMLLPTLRYQGRAGLLLPLLGGARFPDELLRSAVTLHVALAAGDPSSAQGHYASLRAHGFRHAAGALARTDVLVALADACVMLGEAEDARALHSLLSPWREFCASDGAAVSLGAIARALGELEAMCGDHAQAERSFRRAMLLNRKLGHRPELVRTRLGLARVLQARGQTTEAQRLTVDARREATVMGMEPWVSGSRP